MKKLILLTVVILSFTLSSCNKEEAAIQAPETTETSSSVNSGPCTTCGFRSCMNRSHDLCVNCGVSRRPPAGCTCFSGGGSGTGEVETTYVVSPQDLTVPRDGTPAYVSVLVVQGAIYGPLGLDWSCIDHTIDFNRFDVSFEIWKNNGNIDGGIVIRRVPGVYTGGEECTIKIYRTSQKQMEDLIGQITFV